MPPKSKKTRKPTATGDCYEAAGKYMLDNSDSESLVLVHAEVMGQGPLEGTTFGHAFVVDADMDFVIDKSNGRNITMPKVLYYAIGQIERLGNYHEYDLAEMKELILRHGHWGPWDLKTRSGL